MTIDEIFAALPEEPAQDAHEYLVIDPAGRTIKVPEAERILGVESDEDAERKYFICPRYVGDGLDLSGMYLTVFFRNAGGDEDGYLVQDVAVNGDYVTFSWLVRPKATLYKGIVQFSVCADLPNTSTHRRPDWNTTLAQAEVLEGLDPDLGDLEEGTSDVLTQLRDEVATQTAAVEAVGAAQVTAVKAAGTASTQEAVAAIQAQGAATNASIPAEYAELEATVDRLTRDRAAAIVCQAQGTAIQVTDASNDPLQGLRIFGKSTQDGTPTPDAPVEIVSTPAPVVTVCGKNLLNLPQTIEKPESGYNYDLFTKTAGQSTAVPLDKITSLPYVEAGKNYYFSYKLPSGAATLEIKVMSVNDDGTIGDGTGAASAILAVNTGAFTPANNSRVTVRVGNADAATLCDMQLELGEVATEYEPYKGGNLAITTPGSLPGIPVASGGNYTDANGQQWIADEVDLARGVYVQRVGTRLYDGSEDENWTISGMWYYLAIHDKRNNRTEIENALMCSHFMVAPKVNHLVGYISETYFESGNVNILVNFDNCEGGVDNFKTWLQANPITVKYVLATPIETPLSDAEITAFKALHSNKPNTTILNDAGAHMALEYAADPKTYIDNKLAALVAANS